MQPKHGLAKTTLEFRTIIGALMTDGLLSTLKCKSHKLLPNTKLQVLVPFDDIKFAVKKDPILCKLFKTKIMIPSKFFS